MRDGVITHRSDRWNGVQRSHRNIDQIYYRLTKCFIYTILILIGYRAPAISQPAPRNNSESIFWGKSEGGWNIYVDTTVGYGCFALQQYEKGTILRIGINPQQQKLYIMISNEKWTSLEIGKKYVMQFIFDEVDKYNGELHVINMGSTKLLWHNNINTDFWNAFMQRNWMAVYYNGKIVTNLSLKGTFAAASEVISCQKRIIEALPQSSSGSNSRPAVDPFSPQRPRAQSQDPFE